MMPTGILTLVGGTREQIWYNLDNVHTLTSLDLSPATTAPSELYASNFYTNGIRREKLRRLHGGQISRNHGWNNNLNMFIAKKEVLFEINRSIKSSDIPN